MEVRLPLTLCPENPYLLPKLYVKGLPGDSYLVLKGEEVYEVDKCDDHIECFGKRVYGVELEEIVDLLAKRCKRSFIVFPPGIDEGVLIEEGTYLEPIPVEGVRVSMEVCEGLEVKEKDTIAYVLTRKGEVRHIRSHVEGIVVYIYSDPESRLEENIVFIAPKEAVKIVRLRREKG